MTPEWRRIELCGIVQGFGIRPAVLKQARALGLLGRVSNTQGSLLILVGGEESNLDRFQRTLPEILDSGARIDLMDIRPCLPIETDEFSIFPSELTSAADAVIPPDLATCGECLRDLSEPSNRRFRYAFTSCAQCGPRYTIVYSLPYDRSRTTMQDFPLCEKCRGEYASPDNRRFHAEGICCPDCGPQLKLMQVGREPILGDTALRRCVELIREGSIGVIKGIGGFHLCCDATQEKVVGLLRQNKRRPQKPLAVMAGSTNKIKKFAHVCAKEESLLESCQRPIVLLRKKDEALEYLSPDNARIGVMLPSMPLHHLLMETLDLVVMTSANEAEEPIFAEDEEVEPWLGGAIDFVFTHNRQIWNRCDDSVLLVKEADHPVLIRRSRGYVPQVIRLSQDAPVEMLCCGGDLKNVFALVRGKSVYLSAHMGDLENAAALENFETQIECMKERYQIRPAIVVHDLHPAYHSTQYALQAHVSHHLSIQHHHAHLAACLAENDCTDQAIGIIFDGTGYGMDGTAWGGEFLVGNAAGFRRAASFRPFAMPGGEMAIHRPWRMALAALGSAIGLESACRFIRRMVRESEQEVDALAKTLEVGAPFPITSSMGRLFDIVAFLLGAGADATFEAQHAQWLEARALNSTFSTAMPPFENLDSGDFLTINPAPFLAELVAKLDQGESVESLAAAFHQALVDAACATALRISAKTGIRTVACSGGVFLNEVFSTQLCRQLRDSGMNVLEHCDTPPGDGCLALGQAAIAAEHLFRERGS